MDKAFDAFDDIEYLNEQTDEQTTEQTTEQTDEQTNYNPDRTESVIYITKSGAFIDFDDISYKSTKKYTDEVAHMKMIRKIENYFTLKTLQIIGAMKQTKRCKVDKKKRRIIVPRFGIFEILNKKFGLSNFCTISQIKPGNKPVNDFKWTGTLKPNQIIIADYLKNNIYTESRKKCGSAGCILNLEAGQGKSFLAAYFMSIFNKKTLIVLHSTSLIDQWKSVIESCYSNMSIGEYHGKKKTDGDIVLIVINSLLSDEFTITKGKRKTKTITKMKPLEYFNQFGFIIYDECHEYANKNSGKAFNIAQAPYMLGLSATPDENVNKFDKLVWWGLGPVVDASKLNGYKQTSNDFSGIVHRKMYYGKPKYTRLIKNPITDMVSVSETLGMICEDDDRNNLVIDCIIECLEKQLYTFVFADRRNYLDILRVKLQERITIKKEDIEMLLNPADYVRIVGGTKNDALASAESSAKVIFTTYQYMGTGKSIVKMNGLVLATPRKSKMKQYIKRIFRLGSDMSITRHIYDIVDMKTTLKNQWNVRKKYYNSQNFEIIDTKHDSNKLKTK